MAAWADAGSDLPLDDLPGLRRPAAAGEHYPAMVRWVEYCRRNSTGLLRPAQGFGDWLSIEADTPKDVLATAYFAHSTQLTAAAARDLGKADDAAQVSHELFDANQACIQSGLRRGRRPDQGQHADRLRAGLGVRSVVRREPPGGRRRTSSTTSGPAARTSRPASSAPAVLMPVLSANRPYGRWPTSCC